MNLVYGRNTLVVPKEEPPETIHVYVVTTPTDRSYPSLTRYAAGKIEVMP